MSLARSGRFIAMVAVLVACSTDGTDPAGRTPDLRKDGSQAGLSLTIRSTGIQPGSTVKFDFANGSSQSVTTGELGCVNSYEQQDGDTWRTLESFRMCTMIAQIHRAGETTSHETPAPDGPGTYRLVVQGWLEGDDEQVVVRSAPFAVTAP